MNNQVIYTSLIAVFVWILHDIINISRDGNSTDDIKTTGDVLLAFSFFAMVLLSAVASTPFPKEAWYGVTGLSVMRYLGASSIFKLIDSYVNKGK
jgi:hypothetical protein